MLCVFPKLVAATVRRADAAWARIEQARRRRSPDLEARALGGLCDANYHSGRMLIALTFAEQCFELAESVELALEYMRHRSAVVSY